MSFSYLGLKIWKEKVAVVYSASLWRF